MIKELRIGNFVNKVNRDHLIHFPEREVLVIQELGYDCVVYPLGKNPANLSKMPVIYCGDLSPISLTEEWLLKFGFEYDECKGYSSDEDGDRKVFSYKGFDVSIEKNGKIHVWEHNDEDNWYSRTKKELKFVHKLQNYFYESEDEELQLKTLAQ